jgi:polysaccharide export outer membrane protein
MVLASVAISLGSGPGVHAESQENNASTPQAPQQDARASLTKDSPTAGDKPVARNNPGSAIPDAGAPPLVPRDYRIGVDDELMVSVWHEAELSQAVVVRPDGMITMPLLNDIRVVGLTPEEMQLLLVDKLKTLVNDPQVTVSIKAVHSRKVFVVGNVAKQGVYPLGGSTTVLQVIIEAGGLGVFAKSRSIYVLRKENGQQVRLPINYKKALSGKSPDLVLQPGDMVVVP